MKVVKSVILAASILSSGVAFAENDQVQPEFVANQSASEASNPSPQEESQQTGGSIPAQEVPAITEQEIAQKHAVGTVGTSNIEEVKSIIPIDSSFMIDYFNHRNNKDVEAIISSSLDDVNVVLTDGTKVVGKDDLRKMLVSEFASQDLGIAEVGDVNVRMLSADVAILDADVTITMHKVVQKRHCSIVAKYDGFSWKTSYVQPTLFVAQSSCPMQDADTQSATSIKMLIIAIIGGVIGFFASRLMPSKEAKSK